MILIFFLMIYDGHKNVFVHIFLNGWTKNNYDIERPAMLLMLIVIYLFKLTRFHIEKMISQNFIFYL
jgi:hypothetical protein